MNILFIKNKVKIPMLKSRHVAQVEQIVVFIPFKFLVGCMWYVGSRNDY